MLDVIRSNKFKKDYKRCIKQGKDIEEIKRVILILARPETLPRYYLPHALQGELNGWLECHIDPDWLLIYRYGEHGLELFRTGSHAELFKK